MFSYLIQCGWFVYSTDFHQIIAIKNANNNFQLIECHCIHLGSAQNHCDPSTACKILTAFLRFFFRLVFFFSIEQRKTHHSLASQRLNNLSTSFAPPVRFDGQNWTEIKLNAILCHAQKRLEWGKSPERERKKKNERKKKKKLKSSWNSVERSFAQYSKRRSLLKNGYYPYWSKQFYDTENTFMTPSTCFECNVKFGSASRYYSHPMIWRTSGKTYGTFDLDRFTRMFRLFFVALLWYSN